MTQPTLELRDSEDRLKNLVDDILGEVDCINLLRVQFERQRGAFDTG